jgi:hypothetical protein
MENRLDVMHAIFIDIAMDAIQIFILQTHPFEYTSIPDCFTPPKEGIKKLPIANVMKSLRKFGMHPLRQGNHRILFKFENK